MANNTYDPNGFSKVTGPLSLSDQQLNVLNTIASGDPDQTIGRKSIYDFMNQLGLDPGQYSGIKAEFKIDPNAFYTPTVDEFNNAGQVLNPDALSAAAQQLGIDTSKPMSTEDLYNEVMKADATGKFTITGDAANAPGGDQNTRYQQTFDIQDGKLTPVSNAQTYQQVPQSEWTSNVRPVLQNLGELAVTAAAPEIAPELGAAILPEADAATAAMAGNLALNTGMGLATGQDPSKLLVGAGISALTPGLSGALTDAGVSSSFAPALAGGLSSGVKQLLTTGSVTPYGVAMGSLTGASRSGSSVPYSSSESSTPYSS
jgi:hypothetical protein